MATDPSCVFCRIVAGEVPAEIVYADDSVVAFLDTKPVFHGHTLLVPRTHVRTLPELPPPLVAPFFSAAQRLERAVESATVADGALIIINNVVSQSVPHLHLHVIPRRFKDGLRFWLGPRHPYTADAPAADMAALIRAALET